MEPTIIKPRLKFKPPLKFFKFGHRSRLITINPFLVELYLLPPALWALEGIQSLDLLILILVELLTKLILVELITKLILAELLTKLILVELLTKLILVELLTKLILVELLTKLISVELLT